MQNKIWKEYVWGKQTFKQLSKKYSKSIPYIKKQIDSIVVENDTDETQEIHIIADVVFFGKKYGIVVFHCPKLKRNIYWAEVETETPLVYSLGRKHLEQTGKLTSATLDGRRGVASVFKDIPVQMCQFHQIQIVTRYLTRKPKLEAGKKLRLIVLKLTISSEKEFTETLNAWYTKWQEFLKEKTTDSINGRWYFTHKKLRSAYRSLNTNLPRLFVYRKFTELNISNTTNSLDGSFSYLKTLLRIHRGQSVKNRKKMIDEILKNRPDS